MTLPQLPGFGQAPQRVFPQSGTPQLRSPSPRSALRFDVAPLRAESWRKAWRRGVHRWRRPRAVLGVNVGVHSIDLIRIMMGPSAKFAFERFVFRCFELVTLGHFSGKIPKRWLIYGPPSTNLLGFVPSILKLKRPLNQST